MGKARPLPNNVVSVGKSVKKNGGLEYAFRVTCSCCGRSRVVKRRQHAISMASKPCKSCSNKNNNPIGLVGGIRASFFNKYITGAHQRNKHWGISIQDAAEKLNSQNNVCALSGLKIDAGASGCKLADITASLDRIDNSKGYEIDNIQWVHKDINMMRGSLPVDKFIELCKLVSTNADKVKW